MSASSGSCDICKLNPPRFIATRTVRLKGQPVRYERWRSCLRCRDQARRMHSRDITFTAIREDT